MAENQSDDPLARLPHGPEFRFLQSLTILQPGESAEGTYVVPDTEELVLLRGHFPGDPMLPGVLLAEMLAQAAGALVQADPAQVPLENLRLTSVQNLKILRPAYPGDQLIVRVKIQARLGHLVQAEGEILQTADNEPVAKGRIALSGDPPAGKRSTAGPLE